MIRELKKHVNNYDLKYKALRQEIMKLEDQKNIKHKLICVLSEEKILKYLKELKHGSNINYSNDDFNSRNFFNTNLLYNSICKKNAGSKTRNRKIKK